MNDYVPQKGDRVRVLSVCAADPQPQHARGDMFYASDACEMVTTGAGRGYVYVSAQDTPGYGTWAVVERVLSTPCALPPPSEDPADAPPPIPPAPPVATGMTLADEPVEWADIERTAGTAAASPQGRGINPKEAAAEGAARLPWDALPVRALVGPALAFAEGAHKYGRHNYRGSIIKAGVYFAATLRHVFAWWEGEDIDKKSSLHHLDKAIASLLVVRDAMLRGMCDDDRPPRCEDGWIDEGSAKMGEMRTALTAAHGPAKKPITQAALEQVTL